MRKIIIIPILFLVLIGSVLALEITDDFECNGFGCGTGWTGGWATSGDCIITTLSNPIDAYHFRGQSGCDATRYFDSSHSSTINISFYATASSLESGDYCKYYYFDGTNYHEVLSLTDGDDDGIHDYYEFDVSGYGVATDSGIRISGGLAGADYCYIDDVLIKIDDEPITIDYVGEVGKLTNQTNIQVFGTEYQPFDEAKVFAQLVEGENPINNATCFANVFYPDGSLLYQDVLMTYQQNSNGLYYFDLTAPNISGVYMVDVVCQYYTDNYYNIPSSIEIIAGDYVSGNNYSIQESDDEKFIVKEYVSWSGTGNSTLVMDWTFDEISGATLQDSSPFSNQANLSGSPNLTISGTSNTAIKFDGIDDYAIIPNNGQYNLDSDEELVVCFGINTMGDIPNDGYLIDMKDGGLTGWEIRGADDEIRFSTDRDDSGNKNHETAFKFEDNDWHKVCFFSGFSQMISYVDGNYDKTTSATQLGSINTTEPFVIGSENDFGGFSEEMIDELCVIYGTELNISAISTQYNSSSNCGGLLEVDEFIELEVKFEGVSILNDTNYIMLLTEYQWNDNIEDVFAYVYNFNTSTWDKTVNDLDYTLIDLTISSMITGDINDYINSTGEMIIKYIANQTDTISHKFEIDYISIVDNYAISTPVTDIRGGGELHITKQLTESLNWLNKIWQFLSVDVWDMLSNIWNQLFKIESQLNQTIEITNETLQYVKDINNSINNNISVEVDFTETHDLINEIYNNISLEITQLETETGNDFQSTWNILNDMRNFQNATYQDIFSFLTQIDNNINQTTINLNASIEVYINDVQAEIELLKIDYSVNVMGTDYTIGDNGRIFIQLIRNNTGFNDAYCLLDVHYPDSVQGNPNYFIENGLLVPLGTDGMYYSDFTAPNVIGIYMISAECFIGADTTRWNVTTENLIEGSVSSGSFADIHEVDTTYYKINEQINSGQNKSYIHEFEFNVTGLTGLLNETSTIGLLFQGRMVPDDIDAIKFQFLNYTSGLWVDLPNQLYSQSSSNDILVANTGDGSGAPDYIINDIAKIRLIDTDQITDTKVSSIFIDRLWLALTHPQPQPVLGVAGGGELNIRAPTNYSDVLSNITLNTNLTEVIDLIESVNDSLHNEIIYTQTLINSMNQSLYNKMEIVESKTDLAIELIQNLTLQFNSSNVEVLNYLYSMNTNITSEFNNIDNEFNIIQSNLSNIDNSITNNFNSLNQSINDLDLSIDDYFDWLNITLIEMKSEIYNIETMTTIINQSVEWLVEWHDEFDDLHLTVTAPALCLLDSNWLVYAHVQDQFGFTMSPNDNMVCQMTTDLWGTENMSFNYGFGKYKYIHVCDPITTIFNWSVNCFEN